MLALTTPASVHQVVSGNSFEVCGCVMLPARACLRALWMSAVLGEGLWSFRTCSGDAEGRGRTLLCTTHLLCFCLDFTPHLAKLVNTIVFIWILEL